MNRSSTILLKAVLSLIALAALPACVFGAPGAVTSETAKTPNNPYVPYLFWAGVLMLSIPFFVGLYQGFKLLTYMAADRTFSDLSVRALKRIKFSAIAITALMVAGIAALMVISRGKGEDITGVVAPGLLVTLASIVVASFAAVFQRQVQKAIGVKSGNHLTA